jgi:SAM-dependent methyltransferase
MDRTHEALVDAQFGSRAAAYVASEVHAQGQDLARMAAVLRERPGARVLDLGCGGGHVSYTAAPLAAEVVAFDLSEEMLAAVARTARERGLANITTRRGVAERLPFEEQQFDLVLCRFTAHHWHDVEAGLREARRVLVRGGIAVFTDVIAPGRPLLDTHLQAIELLRDPSHVRDYGAAEWVAALGRAGLVVTGLTPHRLRLEFASWIERMRTPETYARAILALQAGAPAEVRQHFAIDPDGSFVLDVLTVETCAG